jgi:hypothetical protein
MVPRFLSSANDQLPVQIPEQPKGRSSRLWTAETVEIGFHIPCTPHLSTGINMEGLKKAFTETGISCWIRNYL